MSIEQEIKNLTAAVTTLTEVIKGLATGSGVIAPEVINPPTGDTSGTEEKPKVTRKKRASKKVAAKKETTPEPDTDDSDLEDSDEVVPGSTGSPYDNADEALQEQADNADQKDLLASLNKYARAFGKDDTYALLGKYKAKKLGDIKTDEARKNLFVELEMGLESAE